MKFSTAAIAISALSGASAAAVKRDAPAYTLLSVHSGDQNVHLRPIGVSPNGHLTLDAETSLKVSVDGQFLNVVDSSDFKYVGIEGDSLVASQKYATSGFGLEGTPNHSLTFDGKRSFVACPSGNSYEVTVDGKCDGGVGIDVLAFSASS